MVWIKRMEALLVSSNSLAIFQYTVETPFQIMQLNNWLEAASSGDFNQFLSEVRWLEWYPDIIDLSPWTINLLLPNLVVLQLEGVEITEEWEGWSAIRVSNKLRYLSLHNCYHLRCTLDLSAFTQLKILILSDCWGLEHLHPSIGKLKSLVSLNLDGCEHLKELPDEVGELDDLEELTLVSSVIEEIPTSIGSLKKLKTLNFSGCESLRGIPTSIGDLQNLQHLYVSGFLIEKLPSSIGRLENLKALYITVTTISDVPELPSGLTSLWISCQSPRLPQLSSLIHLEELYLFACHLLEDIPKLASRLLKLFVMKCDKLTLLKPDRCKHLEDLSIKICCSIETLDLSQLIHLKRLEAAYCNNLVEVQDLDKLESLEKIDIRGCKSFERHVLSKSRCLNIYIDGHKCGV